MSHSPPPSRLPSLDGLRAISIALVFFSHLIGGPGFLPAYPALDIIDYGNFGVRVFFVISGYLISTLLFHEMAKTGTVSLPKFYVRRAFRIFPAFYVNVAIIAALAAFGILTLMPGDVMHAVTYTTNYHYARSWNLGHLWSLAVEEQFYLLWPAILLLFGRTRGLIIAALFVLAAPVIRVATYRFHLSPAEGIGESFQTVGDSIAVGCLLAGFQTRLEASPRYRAFQASPAFIVVPLLAVVAATFHRRPLIDFALGQTTTNICVALVIHWCIRHYDGRVGRFLNSRVLAYVGTLSYSLYVWQQIFLDRTSTAPFAIFPLNLAVAIGAALVSYYAVERPFLRWRERLEPRLLRRRSKTPNAT